MQYIETLTNWMSPYLDFNVVPANEMEIRMVTYIRCINVAHPNGTWYVCGTKIDRERFSFITSNHPVSVIAIHAEADKIN